MDKEMEQKLKKLKKINERMSQEEMAGHLNVRLNTVNRWINGKSIPSRLAVPMIDSFILKFEALTTK